MGVWRGKSLGIDFGAGAEGVLANVAGAGVCKGSDCWGGGLGERELDGEAEGDGDGEGEDGLFIVIAGAGVAGTCFSVPISFSVLFSCSFS